MSEDRQSGATGPVAPLDDEAKALRRRRRKQIPALYIFLGFLLMAGIYRVYFWI